MADCGWRQDTSEMGFCWLPRRPGLCGNCSPTNRLRYRLNASRRSDLRRHKADFKGLQLSWRFDSPILQVTTMVHCAINQRYLKYDFGFPLARNNAPAGACLLYTSDAA